MPVPDPPRAARKKSFTGLHRSQGGGGRKRRGGGEPELEPVEPDKPKPLSGGAAAELEFDD